MRHRRTLQINKQQTEQSVLPTGLTIWRQRSAAPAGRPAHSSSRQMKHQDMLSASRVFCFCCCCTTVCLFAPNIWKSLFPCALNNSPMFSFCLCDVASLKIDGLCCRLERLQSTTQCTSRSVLPPVFVMLCSSDS